MENTSKNIDELLRQRLRNAAVPPPAFVWPNVERALRKRKRRFFFWLLLAGVSTAGIWSVWSRPHSARPPAGIIRTAPASSDRQAYAPSLPGKTAAATAPATATAIEKRTPEAVAAKTRETAPVPNRKSGAMALAIPTLPATAGTGGVIALTTDSHAPEKIAVGNITTELLPVLKPLAERRAAQPAFKQVTTPQAKPKKAPRRCYDFHNNRQAWLIDAYAGPALGHKLLHTGNPEYIDYLQNRLETEHREIGFNAGFRASYLFAENFLLRTGIHYDQTVERFEYIDPNFIQVNVRITQKYVNGNWITVTDTLSILYGSNYQKTYNRFGTLDIPLQAAMELRSGPTGVSLNLGGSINLLFWKRGSMLALNDKPASFRPRDEQFDVFKTRVGMSILGSLQWFYHLNPRTRVFAEPYYRHILQPVMRPGYPVRQTYGISGVRFGVTRILD